MAKEEANQAAKAKALKKAKEKGGIDLQIILSPTGAFNLAYNVGDIVKDFDAKKGQELIDAEYAILVK